MHPRGYSLRSAKAVVFIAIMSALGNVLSFISITVSPIIPSIPLGPISISLALDLSHVTTFIAALFGGPLLGGSTGLIGGLVAAYQFGFSQGNLVSGFAIPVGKALTGITAGVVIRAIFNPRKYRMLIVPTTVASYIPEAVFTAFIFIVVIPIVFRIPSALFTFIAVQILVKAFVEMVVMGLILATMLGNRGFKEYVEGFFA
jgi:hypothetical protein